MSVVSASIDGSSGLGGMLLPALKGAVVSGTALYTCVVSAIVAQIVGQSIGSG